MTNLGAQTLEYIGPLYVFQEANYILAHSGRAELGYDVEVVTTRAGTVDEMNGLKIVADRPYHHLRGPVDTLMFQAVDESELVLKDAAGLARALPSPIGIRGNSLGNKSSFCGQMAHRHAGNDASAPIGQERRFARSPTHDTFW